MNHFANLEPVEFDQLFSPTLAEILQLSLNKAVVKGPGKKDLILF
jgi:hypothetical protein